MRWIVAGLGLLAVVLLGVVAFAQDVEEDLSAENVRVVAQMDAFGLLEEVVIGDLRNNGEMAYANLTIYGDVLDEDGNVIGEAFGYTVDQCGNAILDFPLQPGRSQRFVASLDLFEEGDIADIEIFPEGEAVEPEVATMPEDMPAITTVSDQEVVSVEWEDEGSLRYGVGCDQQVLTDYDWYRYDVAAGESTALDANPNEQYITEAFITQTGINQVSQSFEQDESLFSRSRLVFPTQTDRVVYQIDIHTVITAEVDGSFKRTIHRVLSQYTLQGYVWSPLGNFVAYYFGAYGEPVRYFTASAENGLISALLPDNTPSATVPGLYNDGRTVIISGTFPDAEGQDVTGYYLSSPITQQRELLFEAEELPGNNYPAPVYYRKDDSTRYIYVVRPLDDQAVLQCYHVEGGELTTLTELPLDLATDERAWSFMSADFNTLAIAANGDHSGLWLVDLTEFDACR
ncbi:MAG: hypothetical protein KC496_03005 [Anaerolineae bacterium]|nr:hypothetical protein [Anaerolineae bacterium]